MAAFLLFLLAVVAILCAPSWYVARREGRWFFTDYLLVATPVPLWVVLTALGLGPQSLSNVVELAIIAAWAPGVLALRVFGLDRLSPRPRVWSALTFLAGVAAPVLLRLFMPLLPE